MNVLWVCGVMRLEENAEAAKAPPTEESAINVEQMVFDAWPSLEGKAMVDHAKRLGNRYVEVFECDGEPPEKWWEYPSDVSSDFSFDGEHDY